jgi:ring-1,2-phenylacetyl-CoA epoxidase subunit PaaE
VSSRTSVFHPLRVAAIDELTDDAVALTLEVPEELRDDYAFTAGQHVAILGPDGVRRSYSLASTPRSGVLRIGIKKLAGGTFSEGVLPGLGVGDTLQVMRPAGRFTVVPDRGAHHRYAAIAAGSGITPVLSIITTLLEEEPHAFVTLVYANRTQRSIMFADEVAGLKDRFPDRFQLLHVLSRETQDVELLSGRLDGIRLKAILDAWIPPDDVDGWFLCGPQQMVLDLRDALVEAGVPGERVHGELFHADPTPHRPDPTAARLPGDAHVTIRLDGRESDFTLAPDGQPILHAALAVRPDLPFACQGGVCGTCRAWLVEGTVSMDASWALEPEEIEQGYVLTCQSHPTSERVVLDYDG